MRTHGGGLLLSGRERRARSAVAWSRCILVLRQLAGGADVLGLRDRTAVADVAEAVGDGDRGRGCGDRVSGARGARPRPDLGEPGAEWALAAGVLGGGELALVAGVAKTRADGHLSGGAVGAGVGRAGSAGLEAGGGAVGVLWAGCARRAHRGLGCGAQAAGGVAGGTARLRVHAGVGTARSAPVQT